jgi:hypothetical protein
VQRPAEPRTAVIREVAEIGQPGVQLLLGDAW